jgi:hypothetical protein
VTKKYSNFNDLAKDIRAKKYNDNLLFRRRDDWESSAKM